MYFAWSILMNINDVLKKKLEVDFVVLTEPFPHVIINNSFTPEELKLIWVELQFLSQPHKLQPPEQTGTAWKLDSSGNRIFSKNNAGLWLDDIYKDRNLSDILKFNRKIFDATFIEDIVKQHWFFNYLKYCNNDMTLLSYYEDGGYYKPHPDVATITVVTHLFKEPRLFEGGDLSFPDFDYNVGLVNNRTIMFPSIIEHEVSNVKVNSNEELSGRFTISQFIRLAK
jgi:hypothetical protein